MCSSSSSIGSLYFLPSRQPTTRIAAASTPAPILNHNESVIPTPPKAGRDFSDSASIKTSLTTMSNSPAALTAGEV